MVNLFLPSVGPGAISLQRTALIVVANKSACLPILTQFSRVIVKQVRLAPKVLPVMSILTLGLVVLLRQVGAPFSLKVEHVEVWLLWVLVNESCFQIDFTVSE